MTNARPVQFDGPALRCDQSALRRSARSELQRGAELFDFCARPFSMAAAQSEIGSAQTQVPLRWRKIPAVTTPVLGLFSISDPGYWPAGATSPRLAARGLTAKGKPLPNGRGSVTISQGAFPETDKHPVCTKPPPKDDTLEVQWICEP
jgi:hypothetical protein